MMEFHYFVHGTSMMFFRAKPNLDDVAVAAPCPSSWEGMEGDDKVRYCSLCSLNVYNLSGMTRKEGEALMKSATGPLCIRLYRRQDGTLITKDCPVGRRIADACKRRLRAIAMALFACIQAAPAFSEDSDERRLAPRAGVSFAPNKWRKDALTTANSTPEAVENGTDKSKESIDETKASHTSARWGNMSANPWHKEEVPMPRGYSAPPPIKQSATQGAVKQNTLDAFKAMFGKPTAAKMAPLRADRSALDAFNEAQKAESTGFTSRAAMRYEFAIYQFIRDANAYDPVFKKQVATAYAKFLKKQNQPEQAKAILDEFCKKR